MPSLPTITVTGSSSISHVAERGVATIIVSSESTSQEDVATNVRSASASLKALLTSLTLKDPSGAASPDAPVTHWSNSSLSTSTHMVRVDPNSSNDNRMVRRHSARMSFQVKFQDFEKLGAVVTQLSTVKHLTIQGIDWRLTEETMDRLGAKGRGDAMRDAVRRATDYFRAMDAAKVLCGPEGGKEVNVVEVIEGYSTSGQSSGSLGRTGYMEMRAPSSSGGGQKGIEFTPEDVHLDTQITVKFEVVPVPARNFI